MAKSGCLKTERLLIHPFEERHITSQYINWLNDHEVMQYSEQRHKRHTRKSCLTYLKSFDESPHFLWAIIVRDNKWGHIGNINAYVNEFNGIADIGILIGEKDVWGLGYGSEAWNAICDFLLRQRKIRKVTAGALTVNKGMIRLMMKAGMQPDGLRKRHFLYKGEESDLTHMALFREG